MTKGEDVEPPPRALILARTAMTPVNGEDANLKAQLAAGRSAVAKLNFELVEELPFPGRSGVSDAIGHSLLELVDASAVDFVIVFANDRISRSSAQLRMVLHELGRRGVTVAATSEGLAVGPAANWIDCGLLDVNHVV